MCYSGHVIKSHPWSDADRAAQLDREYAAKLREAYARAHETYNLMQHGHEDNPEADYSEPDQADVLQHELALNDLAEVRRAAVRK